MRLAQFLHTLIRIRPAEPDATEIRFMVGDEETPVRVSEFDVEQNRWVIRLREVERTTAPSQRLADKSHIGATCRAPVDQDGGALAALIAGYIARMTWYATAGVVGSYKAQDELAESVAAAIITDPEFATLRAQSARPEENGRLRDGLSKALKRITDLEGALVAAEAQLARQPAPDAAGVERLREALERAWVDFLDANPDGLTSPEDLPNHALVTCEQMIGIVDAALATSAPDASPRAVTLDEPKDRLDLLRNMMKFGVSGSYVDAIREAARPFAEIVSLMDRLGISGGEGVQHISVSGPHGHAEITTAHMRRIALLGGYGEPESRPPTTWSPMAVLMAGPGIGHSITEVSDDGLVLRTTSWEGVTRTLTYAAAGKNHDSEEAARASLAQSDGAGVKFEAFTDTAPPLGALLPRKGGV